MADVTLGAKDMGYLIFTIGIGFSLLTSTLNILVEREVVRRYLASGKTVRVRNISFPVVARFFNLWQLGIFKGTMLTILLVSLAALSQAGTYLIESRINYRSTSALLREKFRVGNPVLQPILNETLDAFQFDCDIESGGAGAPEEPSGPSVVVSADKVINNIVSSGVGCYDANGTSVSVGLTAVSNNTDVVKTYYSLESDNNMDDRMKFTFNTVESGDLDDFDFALEDTTCGIEFRDNITRILRRADCESRNSAADNDVDVILQDGVSCDFYRFWLQCDWQKGRCRSLREGRDIYDIDCDLGIAVRYLTGRAVTYSGTETELDFSLLPDTPKVAWDIPNYQQEHCEAWAFSVSRRAATRDELLTLDELFEDVFGRLGEQ